MAHAITTETTVTIGLDLGDRQTAGCVVDEGGQIFERFEARTPPTRLLAAGYVVVVANARRVRLIAENDAKSDRLDAELLRQVPGVGPLDGADLRADARGPDALPPEPHGRRLSRLAATPPRVGRATAGAVDHQSRRRAPAPLPRHGGAGHPGTVRAGHRPASARPAPGRARGKGAKKRAVVAVARKLAVLLHRLWLTGEVYEPVGYQTPVGRAA